MGGKCFIFGWKYSSSSRLSVFPHLTQRKRESPEKRGICLPRLKKQEATKSIVRTVFGIVSSRQRQLNIGN